MRETSQFGVCVCVRACMHVSVCVEREKDVQKSSDIIVRKSLSLEMGLNCIVTSQDYNI